MYYIESTKEDRVMVYKTYESKIKLQKNKVTVDTNNVMVYNLIRLVKGDIM